MAPSFRPPEVTEMTPSSPEKPEGHGPRAERPQPHLLPASLRPWHAEPEPSPPSEKDGAREGRSLADLLSCLM